MVGVQQVVLGYELDQFLFHFQHSLARRYARAIADPENMRIDGHGRLAERRVQHHIRRLAADTWQCLQRFTGLGYLATVTLDQ